MSEAVIVIVLAAFLFGIIMGLCLGKAKKMNELISRSWLLSEYDKRR